MVYGEVGGWGRDPKKCTGRDWGMGSRTISWKLRPVVKYHLRRGVGFMKFLENGSRPQPPTSREYFWMILTQDRILKFSTKPGEAPILLDVVKYAKSSARTHLKMVLSNLSGDDSGSFWFFLMLWNKRRTLHELVQTWFFRTRLKDDSF